MNRFNWPLWSGLVLSLAAFISYFGFFYRFPITRDVPWVNLLLFVAAVVLLIMGIRRSRRRVVGYLIGTIGVLVFGFFLFATNVVTRQLPASQTAPRVGQKAPEFSLLDQNGRSLSLSQLVATAPRGVLLVFYRGHW
jgi:hypothetical protein